MRYRQFGKTGWRVSEIGFGGARIGGLFAQDGGRVTSLRTLEAACDAGINFFDTADMYSQGESEILVGKAFRNKRDRRSWSGSFARVASCIRHSGIKAELKAVGAVALPD